MKACTRFEALVVGQVHAFLYSSTISVNFKLALRKPNVSKPETNHLKLRKMMIPSVRVKNLWTILFYNGIRLPKHWESCFHLAMQTLRIVKREICFARRFEFVFGSGFVRYNSSRLSVAKQDSLTSLSPLRSVVFSRAVKHQS